MIDLSPSDVESTPLSGCEILVVDDDPAVRESVVEILAADGADVAGAENGKVALELIRSRAFDVVLSDVVMPEMDGYELLMEARRLRPDMPVVLMTAFYYDKDHVIKRSRMQGLEGILFKKPLEADKLRDALAEQVVGKQR